MVAGAPAPQVPYSAPAPQYSAPPPYTPPKSSGGSGGTTLLIVLGVIGGAAVGGAIAVGVLQLTGHGLF